MGFGREGECVWGKNPTVPKKSGLQKKQSTPGKPSLPWVSRSVSRAPLQKGEALWQGEQGAMHVVLPQHHLHVPLYLGSGCMSGSMGSGPGAGCALTSMASAGSGQAAPTVGVAGTQAQ